MLFIFDGCASVFEKSVYLNFSLVNATIRLDF